MLDLNLDIVSSENKKVLINGDTLTLALMEDSGPMNSFIINADDVPSNAGDHVENSSNNASALVFDLFKKGTTDDDDTTMITDIKIVEQLSSPEFVTRQLFPVTAFSGEKEGEAKSSSARPRWLNLSYTAEASGGGAAELKAQPRKNRRGPRSRSSQFRGVTFYRRTGRWESHIWDLGKQVYLGGFDTAYAAARAYDRAAIKFRGVEADINFDLSDYQEDMKHMKNMSKEEFVHFLRHQITKFSKGSSNYKGVILHKYGRWESRIGQFLGKKFDDMVEMECNEREAATNFEPSSYEGEITNNGGATFIEVIIAILLPPLGVFLRYGLEVEFWIDLVLSLLGYIPGIIYAIYVLVG